MGMAASQATLLTITSRLHDVEYKAQNIENQKIALATQKDELYQAYCDALDAKKIQVAYNNGDGTKSFIDASFSTLCHYSEDRFAQYSLRNSKTGKVIVDQETLDVWTDFNTDKYAFAYAMLGMDVNFGWDDTTKDEGYRCNMGTDIGIGTAQADYGYGDGKASNGYYNLFMTDVERKVFDKHSTDDRLKKAYDNLTETCNSDSATDADKREALNKFRDTLYNNFSNEIYDYMRLDKQETKEDAKPEDSNATFFNDCPEEYPKSEFEYYVHLFEEIQNAGGCELIDPEYESGEAGNDWLNNMVKSGRVLIDVYNPNKKEWTETSLATSTNANYLQEVQDEADLKKAEAEYEHELDIINRKDTKFDQDLSKLETERNALTTEYDSVKQIVKDNEDRTFGVFG